MRKVDITIDRIVLSGLDLAPGRAEYVRSLVASELSVLLREQPLRVARSSRVGELRAPGLRLSPPTTDGKVARGVARSINDALRGTT